MRRTIDSLVFVSRNRAKITWTAGPSDETHSDTVDAYNENLLKDSDLFTSTNWTMSGATIVTDDELQQPYPLHREYTAMEATDDSPAAAEYFYQTITVPSGVTPYVLSVYVEKTTGALTNYPCIYLYLYGGAPGKTCNVIIDTTNGTLTDGGGIPNAKWISDAGDYWLVTIQLTTNGVALNTNLQARFYPAYNTNGAGAQQCAFTDSSGHGCALYRAPGPLLFIDDG